MIDKLDVIYVDCKQFIARTITILVGTDKERTIKVATTALLSHLANKRTGNVNIEQELLTLDNTFDCFVEPIELLCPDPQEFSDLIQKKYMDENGEFKKINQDIN